MNRPVNYLSVRFSISKKLKKWSYDWTIYALPKISDKNKISKDKKFQFETLFCHITTNEILHLNCVFGLR